MLIQIKQGVFMVLGILGFLMSLVYTQEPQGFVDFAQIILHFQPPRFAGSEPDISDLAQAVRQIQQINLSSIDLSVMMGDEQEPTAARYEYRLTIQQDGERRVRKIHYSLFALQSGDLFDVEEYYDANGHLLYLEYLRFGHSSGGSEKRELTGKVYLRRGQPVKNESYIVRRTPNGIVRVRTQEMPEEYHLTVAALQQTLLRRIESVLVRFRQRLQSPDRLASRPASAIQQQYAQTIVFYEMLAAVFNNEDVTGF